MTEALEMKTRNRSAAYSNASTNLRRHHIMSCAGKSCRKQKRLKSLMYMMLFVSVTMLGLMVYSQPVMSSQETATHMQSASTGTPAPLQGLNEYADYIFIMAVPFGVMLLVSQCATLKSISDKIKQ